MVADLHAEVVVLLRDNRERLDSLAEALLAHEALNEVDAYAG